MTVMTRRNALYTSSLALTVPLAGNMIAEAAVAQPVTPDSSGVNSTSASGNGALSASLQAYLARDLLRLAAPARKGQLTGTDYLAWADKFHLFARHVEQVDTEPFRASIISSFNPAAGLDLSQLDGSKRVFSTLVRHDPALTFEEFQKPLQFSPQELAVGMRSLAAHSIDWHFHSLADTLGVIGKQIATLGPIPSARHSVRSSARLFDAVYQPEFAAHLQRVEVCGLSAKDWCQLIAGMAALGIGLALVLSGTAEGAAAIASLAAYLGWSVELVTLTARLLVWVNGAISFLCGRLPS
jgi:hypothetical protein